MNNNNFIDNLITTDEYGTLDSLKKDLFDAERLADIRPNETIKFAGEKIVESYDLLTETISNIYSSQLYLTTRASMYKTLASIAMGGGLGVGIAGAVFESPSMLVFGGLTAFLSSGFNSAILYKQKENMKQHDLLLDKCIESEKTIKFYISRKFGKYE